MWKIKSQNCECYEGRGAHRGGGEEHHRDKGQEEYANDKPSKVFWQDSDNDDSGTLIGRQVGVDLR